MKKKVNILYILSIFVILSALLTFSFLVFEYNTNPKYREHVRSSFYNLIEEDEYRAYLASISNTNECKKKEDLNEDDTIFDLLSSLYICGEEKKLKEMAEMYYLSSLYGSFDKARVNDISAHQASYILIHNTMAILNQKNENIISDMDKIYGIKEKIQLCEEVKALVKPNYYPSYMINHGMGVMIESLEALSDSNQNEKLESFNKSKDTRDEWERTINEVCEPLKTISNTGVK